RRATLEQARAEGTSRLQGRVGRLHEPRRLDTRVRASVCRPQEDRATHGHQKPTRVVVPPHSAFAVPFAWMLREEQDAIDQSLPDPLPPDVDGPFENTPGVFGGGRR